MSVITDIAEAVKTELNAGSFSQTFDAERYYQPIFDEAELNTLHVSVVPRAMAMEIETRNSVQHDVQIDIAVQKKLNAVTAAEIDPLMELVEEIADFFRLRRLTEYPAACWIETTGEQIYSPEHVSELRTFTSVLTLTYRLAR